MKAGRPEQRAGNAVTVRDLTKVYGTRRVVDGVSFEVAPGEIMGLLGPNGAGKTTTVECIAGLRQPNGGQVEVLGLDPARDARALRKCLGIQLQKEALPENLTVGEAVYHFQRFHGNVVEGTPLLEQLDLSTATHTYYSKLSGGQKQRLHFLLALLGDPRVLIVDEPTTGLDPCARHVVWQMIENLRDHGKSIILTTHFMDEAETLCDRIAFIRDGWTVAQDAPAAFIATLGWHTRIVFKTDRPLSADAFADLSGVVGVSTDNGRTTVYAAGPEILNGVLARAQQAGCVVQDLQSRPAALEDVFIALVGNAALNLSRIGDADNENSRAASERPPR